MFSLYGPTTAYFIAVQILKEGRAGVKIVYKQCVATTMQRKSYKVNYRRVILTLACAGLSLSSVHKKVPGVSRHGVSKNKKFISPLCGFVLHVLLHADPGL